MFSICIAILTLVASFLAQDVFAKSEFPRGFNPPAKIFELAINNPNLEENRKISLVKIGVESELINGDFGCSSAATSLSVLAEYHIDFHVMDKLTMVSADPILEIPGGSSARFNVSVYPNLTGRCGVWAARIRIVMGLSNGKTLYSSWETIADFLLDQIAEQFSLTDLQIGAICSKRDSAFESMFNYLYKRESTDDRRKKFLESLLKIESAELQLCQEEGLHLFEKWISEQYRSGNESSKNVLSTVGAKFKFISMIGPISRNIKSAREGSYVMMQCKSLSLLVDNRTENLEEEIKKRCRF